MTTLEIKTTTTLTFDAGDVPPKMIADAIKKENDGFSIVDGWSVGDIRNSQDKTVVDSVEVIE